MIKYKYVSIITLLLSILIISCSDSSTNNSVNENASSYTTSTNTNSIEDKDPYEVMSVVFEGSPNISQIKPMFEAIMEKYNYEKTDVNRLRIANMLVRLKQASAIGVTEMQILKHIYQNGSNKLTLPNQAGLSAAILEKTN